jgi:hypothetical protein
MYHQANILLNNIKLYFYNKKEYNCRNKTYLIVEHVLECLFDSYPNGLLNLECNGLVNPAVLLYVKTRASIFKPPANTEVDWVIRC